VANRRPRTSRHFVRLVRWATLGSISVGYLLTSRADPEFRLGYFVCALLSIVFLSIVLTRLNKSIEATLPYWILFIYLWLAYYVKFFWFALVPEAGLSLLPFEFAFSSKVALDTAFTTITVAAAAISLSAWLLLGNDFLQPRKSRPKRPSDLGSPSRRGYDRLGNASLWLALGLSVVTTAVTLRTGISVMGVENAVLPYHLSGIISLTRSILIPALFLLAFWAALEARRTQRVRLVFFAMVLFGVTEMLLRSSRGALAPLVLSVAFLLIIKGKLKPYRPLLIASALVIVILHPILSAYRNIRIHAPDAPVQQLVSSASSEVLRGSDNSIRDAAALGITAILLRATGAEILIWYNGLGFLPLGRAAPEVLMSDRGVSGYLTVDVFGFAPDAVNAAAPGFVGWFYLLGGNLFVFFGLALFTWVVHLVWKKMLELHLRAEPVALAIFLTWLTLITVDGVFDSIASRTILFWPLSIIVCEWIARAMTGYASRKIPPSTVHGHAIYLPDSPR
jgi:hypothetical protein